jgi:hypothetical protein
MCLIVAESHTRGQGAKGEADRLKRMLDEWEFSIQWPNLYTQLPGPQKDQADEWLMDQGLSNKVETLKARNGWTDKEAFEHFMRLQEQDAKLAAMGVDPAPAAPPAPQNGFGQPPQPGQPDAGAPPLPTDQPQPQPPAKQPGRFRRVLSKLNPFKDSF